jgi:two-component system sensor histidine kinase BaeS
MRRLGCLFVVVVLMAVAAGAAGVWAVGTALGLVESTHVGRLLAIGGVLVGVVLLLGLGRAVRSFARPVDELVDAAGRIEQGDFSVRVQVRGSGDVRSLARAFNAMSARLEETDRQRRAYLADVTHELRTPLTVIQGQLEGVIDGVYPSDSAHLTPILEHVRTLDGLIEDLRTLTLVETGGLSLRREPVDMAVLITDAVAGLEPAATARSVDLRTSFDGDLPVVDADPVRIRSVLSNLLANGIRHAAAGGTVTVLASAEPAWLRVAVRDTGDGFAPELLPRVFERFVKAPDSPGSGLGLSIARDLITAHGGTISARNEPTGAVVEFTLPLPEPSSR